MPNEQLGLSNDPYNSERAVLSIQDIYIKEEKSESKNNDVMILNDIEDMSDQVQEYNLAADEIISSTDNICMSSMENNQNLLNDFNKMPIELAVPCKTESVKMEQSHFVKYVVRDGKHIKVWECGICAKEFGHQYTLMRHLPTHTDERKFQCNTCGKAFRQMSTLSQHRAIHSAERPYVCEICRKTFNRVSTLISHRKTHTGLKPHRCHLCNKAFHQKGNLRNHIFTHTNERPYKCDVCGKGFNQMSNLMCHKLKAHQRADKPRYSCQICNMEFPKRIALRNHEQYQHGVTMPSDNIAPLPEPPALEHCPPGARPGGPNGSQPTRVRYTNGVLVEPINTDAMKMALRTNQTPFALLRPLNGIPVLVRVLAAGDKQMLVPATAEDLRRHGQITITSTPSDAASGPELPPTTTATATATANNGSTVQIKIPVVATVVQRCTTDGSLCMAVQSPGPKESTADGYVLATTDQDGVQDAQAIVTDPNPPMTFNQNQITQEIQYLDEAGNIITEEEYNAKTQIMNYTQEEFNLLPNDSYVGQTIDLDDTMTMNTMGHNSDLSLGQTVENIDIGSLDSGPMYGVQSALDAIDNMMEQKSLGNDMMLEENGQSNSITMYSDSANILYGPDTQFIL